MQRAGKTKRLEKPVILSEASAKSKDLRTHFIQAVATVLLRSYYEMRRFLDSASLHSE